MSSQLEITLGTNPRNDVTTENSTTVKLSGSDLSKDIKVDSVKGYADHDLKVEGKRVVKLHMVKDIRKYKGRKISLYALTGRYSNLEIILFKGNVQRYVNKVKEVFSNKGQAGWDPLGTFALASSIERIGAEAKALGEQTANTVNDMSSSIGNIVQNAIRDLVPTLTQGVSVAGDIAHNGLDLNMNFTDMFKLFDSPLSSIVTASILYLVIEIIERKYDLEGFVYIKILLAVFMVYKCGKPILSLIQGWMAPVYTTPQADWQDWLTIGCQGVLFLVFGQTVDFSTVTKSIKSLADSATNAVRVNEIFIAVTEWFKGAMSLVCETFGIETFEWLRPQDKKIREFMDRVNVLTQAYAQDPMAIGVEFAEEVTRLLMEINNYVSSMPITSKNVPVSNALRNLQEKMQVLHRNVVDAGMSLGDRNDPAFIVIAGPPGVGKTYLSDFISQDISIDLCETFGEVMDAERDWKTNVYVWPLDNKHHDQYRGEKIVLYPDLFCQTDAEGQPSEATSLIYVVGGQPYQLPAAEITKKQRLYFISQVVIACTNVTYIHQNMFKSVRNPDAVKRRMDQFGWYMYVNPEYIMRHPNGSPIVDPTTNRIRGYERDDEMYGMLDRTLLPILEPGEMPPNLWSFRRINFSKGEFMDNKVFNLENFSRSYKQHIRVVRANGEVKRNNLVARAHALARAKLGELNHGEAGAIEYMEVEERNYEPIPYVPETLFELDLEARQRILLKDELDKLRHREFLRKERRLRMGIQLPRVQVANNVPHHTPDPDTDYDTSDEGFEEYKAQMDDEELYERIQRRKARVAALDREEISEIDFLDLEGSVGRVTASVMHREVDNFRSKNWQLYKTIFHSTLTFNEHRRIKEILEDGARMADLTQGLDLRGLSLVIATKATDFNPRRGIVYRILQAAIYEMQNEPFGDKIKGLSCKSILELAQMDYEQAANHYWECKIDYLIKDPLLKQVTKASIWLGETYNSMIQVYNNNVRPYVNSALSVLRRIYFSHRFQVILDTVLMSVVSGSIGIGLALLLDWYLRWHTSKLKEQKKQDKLNRTKFQGDWINTEMNKKVIDKYMDNMCGMYVVIHMGDNTATRHPCNMLFLGGKTALIVNHAREALVEIYNKVKTKPGHYLEIVIVPFVSTTLEKSTERFRFEDIILESSPELEHYDLAIIKFNHCLNRPHIYNLIPPVQCLEYISDLPNIDGVFIERTTDIDLSFKGPERRIPVRFNLANDPCNYRCSAPVYGEEVMLSTYSYRTWTMKGKDDAFITHAGYCTSPGFIVDDRKNFCTKDWAQAQQPWLCYVHTSLQGMIPNGAPIFREMFTKWIDEINYVKVKPVVDAIQENMDIYSQILEEELKLMPDVEQACKMEIHTTIEKIDLNHTSKASMDYALFIPMKSEIKRSPLYGIDERTRYPSRMGTVRLKDGTIVDTMQKARENYGLNPTLLNGPLIDGIIYQAMARVMSDSSPPKYREVLSLDQCLYGDGAYKLNSVNWSSSAGFYFRMMKEKYGMTWKSKKWMLDDKGIVKPDVHRVLERLFNTYKDKLLAGERTYGLNIDNIKDELLKKEKVLKADSRLFCTNDMINLLLCKSYMGAFAGWIYENRIRNGIAIGVNPLSEEWDSIVTSIVNNSPDCVFMDHSKFDKKQLRQIMKSVLILMDMYYGDKGSLNSRVRMLLFEDIMDSYHVTMYKGKLHFYTWGQGNTSGNFLTAILNSLVNITYLYICSIFAWLIHNGIEPNNLASLPPNPADTSLQAICLGDDIVASIKKDKMPGVNFNTIKMIGKLYLGIDITDELKTEGVIPDFRSITDGSFLGRSFKLITLFGRKRFIGVLRRYSAVERVQWIKGIYDPEIEIEKIENCFLERSLDDREDFEKVVKLYAPACLKEYGRYPRFTDYDVAQRYALTLSEYKYSYNDFMDDEEFEGVDLGKLLLKLKAEEYKNRYESDIISHGETVVSSDFNVKTTILQSPAGGEPSL